MKKCLIIIAPNDRYNYGDLIFTHIVKKKLKDYYDCFLDISTVESDLTSVGGHKVESLSAIYQLNSEIEYDLIVAGGESLCSNWGVCISYLSRQYKYLFYLERILLKFFTKSKVDRIRNYIGRKIYGGKTYYPYTIGRKEIKTINRIFYNSLGGASLTDDNISLRAREILSSVNYIAVRDKNSYNILNRLNIKVNLCPDSAVLMSRYFDISVLEQKISNERIRNIGKLKDDYIVFQINKSIGQQYFKEICKCIIDVFENFGKRIYLCPVGYALGHDDQLILSDIYQTLDKDYILFEEKQTIWDIMYLISNSSMFIGSSLHGVITAMSYSIPYIGIKVKKTIDYIKIWGIDSDLTYSYEWNIMGKIESLLKIDRNILLNNLSKQIELIDDSFNKITKEICNC